jgi:protein phosphatase 1L
MYIANVGDSRAVLCRGKKSIGLSSDHKPDREDEQERIESFGGSVVNSENTGWIARVNGHLAISRSVGDIRLKDPPQGVTAEPEISELDITPEDQFIILASDGLWDVMTNQESVDLVRKCQDKNKAAELLVDKALKLGSADNVTALIVWFSWNLEHVSVGSSSSVSDN